MFLARLRLAALRPGAFPHPSLPGKTFVHALRDDARNSNQSLGQFPVLDAILTWLTQHKLAGTWADVVGLIGFAVTIYAAFKAKSAAVAAKAAAERTRDTIRMFNTVVDFQAVISAIEEIKRLHRQEDSWPSMLDKYAVTRKQLISLRESGVVLNDPQLETVQQAITNLSEMERVVEKSLKGKMPPRVDKLNAMLSDDGDALLAVLEDIKKRGGGPQ